MTGKDLFDAINNIDEKYLDEVIAEIDKGSEQTHESGSYAKNGKSLIGRVLPWMAAVAMIAVLFTVAVAMHQRNRKPDNSEQKPANEATPTMTPTATVTETQIPDEEINTIGVRNRQLVCGENYAADIRADGTVRITTLPGINNIADLHLYKYRVDLWKDIVSLRSGFEMLYAVDQNGHLWSEGDTRDYIRSLIGLSGEHPLSAGLATWLTALPVVEEFIEENQLVDGEYFSPKRSGRNIFLKQTGELVEFVFEDYDIPVCRVLDEKVVSFEGHFYLKEDGTVHTYWDSKDVPVGMKSILKESNICELAENAIGVFGLRKNGTVACCTELRYDFKEIVESWRGVCGIAAEGSTGAVIAAVHTDGTVSAVGIRETGTKEIEEVKEWKNIVAVAVGDNGRFIVGKTADGEILFAVLEGNPVLDELANCSPYKLYDKSMAVATPEQRSQLEAIRDDLYFGCWKEAYTRRILTIMGVMPEDAPYLTVEDAKRLIEEMKSEGLPDDSFPNVYRTRDRFNTVATAPDMDGGSGNAIIKYAVDAEHVKFIEIHGFGESVMWIRYFDGTEETWLYNPYFQSETTGIPIEELREYNPECFELDASNGLTVMVSSFAEGNYQCKLYAGYIDETNLTSMEINQIYNEGTPFNISTMKAILQTYHLSEEKIHIAPVQSVFSSYLYNIDDEYRAKLQELFFGKPGID